MKKIPAILFDKLHESEHQHGHVDIGGRAVGFLLRIPFECPLADASPFAVEKTLIKTLKCETQLNEALLFLRQGTCVKFLPQKVMLTGLARHCEHDQPNQEGQMEASQHSNGSSHGTPASIQAIAAAC